jgi:hypothetical protein
LEPLRVRRVVTCLVQDHPSAAAEDHLDHHLACHVHSVQREEVHVPSCPVREEEGCPVRQYCHVQRQGPSDPVLVPQDVVVGVDHHHHVPEAFLDRPLHQVQEVACIQEYGYSQNTKTGFGIGKLALINEQRRTIE